MEEDNQPQILVMREELKKKTGELKMLEEELNRRKQEDISPM